MNLSSELRHGILRGAIVLLALLAQVSVVPVLAVFGVQPSLLLVVFVLFAFRTGALPSIWLGFVCGTILDTYSSGTAGAFALSMTLVGFAVGQLQEKKIHVGYALRVTVLGVAVVVHDSVWHLASRHGASNLPLFLLRVSLPGMLYTMFLGAILFAIRPPRAQVRTW
jgi:rod shape-determining protein MreD